jgi:hypothetical protein
MAKMFGLGPKFAKKRRSGEVDEMEGRTGVVDVV